MIIFIKIIGQCFLIFGIYSTNFFSLAIQSCEVSNLDDSKNLLLIENFCETEESDPIVRKNLDGAVSVSFIIKNLNFDFQLKIIRTLLNLFYSKYSNFQNLKQEHDVSRKFSSQSRLSSISYGPYDLVCLIWAKSFRF